MCPHGFDPLDADRSSTDFYGTFDGGRTYQNMPKANATLIVQCRDVRRDYVVQDSDLRTLPPEHQPKWKPGEQPGMDAPTPSPSHIPVPGDKAAPVRLFLFGGRDHKIFLGCLCSDLESDSILNKYGTYGSQYSTALHVFGFRPLKNVQPALKKVQRGI